jgi:hypothetical protein
MSSVNTSVGCALPSVLVPTAGQLATLQGMFGFEGNAVLVVLPPPPESAVLQEMRGMKQTMDAMAGDLKTVARNEGELREANATLQRGTTALAAMHGQGLFAFTRYVDQEAREQFMAIMACGNVAEAARDLVMKDSTLRSRLEQWPKRGKAYAALAEMVRWRKSIRGRTGMEMAKRMVSGEGREADFPALIRDVVAELEELDPGNWEERCRSLAEALRQAVS